MSEKKMAALVYGRMAHHLDHIAPLCELLSIPLIVTEIDLLESAKKYYPFIETVYWGYPELGDQVLSRFDLLFCSLTRSFVDSIFSFAQHVHQKRVATVWCPHGNSDKGQRTYFMEGRNEEMAALVYGQKIIDFLIQKGVYSQLQAALPIGNFRHAHYLKHKEHYTALLQEEVVKKLPVLPQTLLYAPTWEDEEKNSSFFDAAPHLIQQLPKDANLIIKIHPNILIQHEVDLDVFLEKWEKKPNLLIVKDFTPIYPLLDFVDLYIGDMSSVGYDFLTLNKPMFFFNPHGKEEASGPALYLHRCGLSLSSSENPSFYSLIRSHLPFDKAQFSAVRKEVYDYTFTKSSEEAVLKEAILKLINSL